MKKIKNAEAEFGSDLLTVTWGQTSESVYGEVLEMLPDAGKQIYVAARKNQGAKSLAQYLATKGLTVSLYGKGKDNLRIYAVCNEGKKPLPQPIASDIINFDFQGTSFTAVTSGALFSKDGLDIGTEFLLETFLGRHADIVEAKIADLGAGWGAIPMVISTLLPDVAMDAYEIDNASVLALEQNAADKNITANKEDILTDDFTDNKPLYDFIVCNPPFHISKSERQQLFANIQVMLAREGRLYFVVESHFLHRFVASAEEVLIKTDESTTGNFTVLTYKRR